MIGKIILRLFVIVLGIVLGGGLYETLVVMPHWTGAIPDSVLAYYQHNEANPHLALNAGGKFWIFLTPLLGLLSIATLVTAFWTRREHRVWRLFASAVALAVVIFTFAWFIPNIIMLMSSAVLTMNPDDVASMANWWVRLNWGRAILYFAAWLAALRAMTISPNADFDA